MDRNNQIEENLIKLIKNLQLELMECSLELAIKEELKDSENVVWINETDEELDKIKEDYKNRLTDLMNNKELHKLLKPPINQLIDPKNQNIQNQFSQEIRNGINYLNESQQTHPNRKINMLFLTHDYGDMAYLSGFEDLEYEFEILTGDKYIKYNYNYQFFNPAGEINYNSVLEPFNKLENMLGEDKIEMLYNSDSAEEYFYKIKELHMLNTYLSIHYTFNNLHEDLRTKKNLFHDEVIVIANEHDCEEFSIYVI